MRRPLQTKTCQWISCIATTFRQGYMLRQPRAHMTRACRCTFRRRSCLAPIPARIQQQPGPQHKCDNSAGGVPLYTLLHQHDAPPSAMHLVKGMQKWHC